MDINHVHIPNQIKDHCPFVPILARSGSWLWTEVRPFWRRDVEASAPLKVLKAEIARVLHQNSSRHHQHEWWVNAFCGLGRKRPFSEDKKHCFQWLDGSWIHAPMIPSEVKNWYPRQPSGSIRAASMSKMPMRIKPAWMYSLRDGQLSSCLNPKHRSSTSINFPNSCTGWIGTKNHQFWWCF